MKLIIDKNRKVYSAGTWGTKNENNYEILDFEFPAELDGYNKRIVYYLGDERVWDAIVNNKAYITNAITKYEKVNAYVWLTKNETITLKYVCDGTEEGNYYFTYDNVNYYFTMPEVEENDELIFDVATSTLKLDNTTIATTSTGTGTELTFETIIDAEEDFRTQLFEMQFYENDNADGIVPTPEQVDGFNTMLTAMNEKIEEINELETTIENAETQRQENEETRQENESTRQENEQTRQEQEAERERRTDEAIGNIEDKTAEYNQNAEEKTEAFNTNATQKTNDFNNNYTQKVNDFNTNASSKELAFNSNAESKTSTFNTNATNKTNDFNSNATQKTNEFNSNASSKTTDFNDNASSKTSAFNTNATSKTNDFNDNATQKTTDFNNNAQAKTEAFDDNATQKTTAFNDNAQAKTEAFDEHTEEMQQEIDELSANMPWGETEQATEIQVTDAAKYSRNKLELFGNTEQTQYTGKNLFSGWEEGSINSTTGEEITYNNRYRSKFIEILPNTDYFFSIVQPSTSKAFWFTIFKYDENKNYLGYQRLKEDKPYAYSNIINIEDINVKFIRITEIALLEYLVDTQLELGTERTDYEPYVGGQPSPSPDYPQDIHVVTGNNTISVGNTDYPINLGSLELCKIGNYQDYLYKENGNWYKYGAIRKYTQTNAVNFSLRRVRLISSSELHDMGTSENPVNLPTPVIINISTSTNSRYNYGWGGLGFVFSQKEMDMIGVENATAFKNYLDANLVAYVVIKPECDYIDITQITDQTLIAQLEAIYNKIALVKGTNHITITPSDLAPYVTLNYMQDLPSKLDNLDSRLSLLE